MPQIVQVKSPVLAAVTDQTGYVKARNQAEKLSQKNGLTVADMPMVIQAMAINPKVRKVIRDDHWIDTTTSEYHGLRDGERSYEVWHSAGSLATVRGFEKQCKQMDEEWKAEVLLTASADSENLRDLFQVCNYFMPISNDEWVAVGEGSYNGQEVMRLHLDDVKRDRVPAPGTPYTIFVRLDRDNPKINDSGRLSWEDYGYAQKVLLDYDTFMHDDRVLMITGSLGNREALSKMLFGKKKDGGEGWSKIGSYHKINEVGFDSRVKGRMVNLSSRDLGLVGGYYVDGLGRFVGVAPEAQLRAKQPTLEQVLAVANQFTAENNHDSLRSALSQLYGK